MTRDEAVRKLYAELTTCRNLSFAPSFSGARTLVCLMEQAGLLKFDEPRDQLFKLLVDFAGTVYATKIVDCIERNGFEIVEKSK
jgi:hypothetical protein